jgi:ribosome-associated protein
MRVTNSITFESKQSLMDNPYKIYTTELDNELNFSFSRSGGPGGQHVNKVNTKVELRFPIADSMVLTEEEKAILLEKLAKQINQEGELIIIAQETRSQLKNKSKAIEKFYDIINKALKPKKKRKPTTISKAAKEKRLKQKKELSEKKERRRF